MASTVFPAAGGGVTQKVQEFTTSGTFTAPSNCSAVEIFLVGGGGGGGGAQLPSSTAFGGGGGGSGVIQRTLSVTPGTSYTVTIGAGGAGGASTASPGGSIGNDSTFGSLATAYGGGSGGGRSDTAGSIQSKVRATSGGAPSSSGGASGGGGAFPSISNIQSGSTTSFRTIDMDYESIGGVMTGQASYGSTASFAGMGIDGFGGGGQGGTNSGASTNFKRISISGGGTATLIFDVLNNGTGGAGTANTGGGGGGASQNTAGATIQAGGAGGSGYCRVTYWS